MSTVLWGKRKGDLQYASRDYWRQTIPIGDSRITVSHSAYFDVGSVFEVGCSGDLFRVSGLEDHDLGVKAF